MPRFGGAVDDDAAAFAPRVLHHHHGVGAGGNGRAGHDLDRLAGGDVAGKTFAGADFADDFELPGQIGGAHRVAVADGARQRGGIAVGGDIFGQHAPGGLEQAEVSSTAGACAPRAHRAEHGFASLEKCQRRHTLHYRVDAAVADCKMQPAGRPGNEKGGPSGRPLITRDRIACLSSG